MLIDDIALTMQPRIGPRTAVHLLACFGSAENVYAATAEQIIEIAQLNPEIARQLAAKNYHKSAEQELQYCIKNNITVIPSYSSDYPSSLREIADYPHVVYYKGDVSALGNRRMLSVVGTRRMTSYGQRVCDRLISDLASMYPDLVIVSGLAYGVDGAAHRAALAAGLATVAVLPNPVTNIYPSQHIRLADQMMMHGGGILSEYNSHTKMKGVTFLARNRIIAGMSMGTLIVESPVKGGAMITARLAGSYDRSVMAVPGRIGDVMSEGTNRLIATDRARMVSSAEDIARELMWDMDKNSQLTDTVNDLSGLTPEARKVLCDMPDGEAISIDALASSLEMSIAEITPLLLELEFEGVVHALPGKLYEKS